jgi:protein-arginine kinase activator protein McsA
MGVEKRTRSRTVTKQKEVEVEDIEEEEIEVYVCDLCGQEDGPEYDDEFHDLVDSPEVITVEEDGELDRDEIDYVEYDQNSLYDRKALVAGQRIVLCPDCHHNLFDNIK